MLSSSNRLQYELSRSARILVDEVLVGQAGDRWLLTGDRDNDPRVLTAIALAAESAGVRTRVLWSDDRLAGNGLGQAFQVWVEHRESGTLQLPNRDNGRPHKLFLGGLDGEGLIRVVGSVDQLRLREFAHALAGLVRQASHVAIFTDSGTGIQFVNGGPGAPSCTLPGTIAVTPVAGTVCGELVLDRPRLPSGRPVSGRMRLQIREGRVCQCQGQRGDTPWRPGSEPKVTVLSVGCHPRARLTGRRVEDRRVWGCTEWRLGRTTGDEWYGDGLCVNSSLYLDGQLVLDQGKVVCRELAVLASRLGM